MKQFYLLLVASILIIGMGSSCNNSTNNKNNIANKSSDSLQGNIEFESYKAYQQSLEIDAITDTMERVESLRWELQTKEYGSKFVKVYAYINKDGLPIKIIEDFSNGKLQPQGRRIFYLQNNRTVYFKELKTVWLDSAKTKYAETRTIFDEQYNPIASQERFVFGYDNIDIAEWKSIPIVRPSLKKARDILLGMGRFQPHFISVVQANNLFLLLGENKENTYNRYTTAVRVTELSPFIKDLLNHVKEYKFRPVTIQFSIVGGNGAPKYSVLNSIKWADKMQEDKE